MPRRRYAEELDCLDVEVLLDLKDFGNSVGVSDVGCQIRIVPLAFGVWQAVALETDDGLLLHHGDGLGLLRRRCLLVVQVVLSVECLLTARSLLAIAALFVFEGGQLQLLDILLPFLQRMQIHVSGAVAGSFRHDPVLDAAVEALRSLPIRVG